MENKPCPCLSHSYSEDDENKIYRAMLQNEVLELNQDTNKFSGSSYCGDSDPYSLYKYKSMTTSDYYNKPIFLRTKEKIPKAPFKVLDAPALKDDFYLNLIDWS